MRIVMLPQRGQAVFNVADPDNGGDRVPEQG
jgi:hypothetical protein